MFLGGPGLGEGEGCGKRAAQTNATGGDGTRAAIRHVLGDVFNNPVVGVEGIMDGVGEEVGRGPAGVDMDDGIVQERIRYWSLFDEVPGGQGGYIDDQWPCGGPLRVIVDPMRVII